MGLSNVGSSKPVITDAGAVLWFGRYQGQAISLVLQEDPHYLVWANENINSFDLHFTLLEVAEQNAERTRWERMSGYFWRLENQEQIWD